MASIRDTLSRRGLASTDGAPPAERDAFRAATPPLLPTKEPAGSPSVGPATPALPYGYLPPGAGTTSWSLLPADPLQRKLLAGITVASFFTRFLWLEFPNEVVYDEVHFGRFTNEYLAGTYFFDIHPPFAKLLFFFLARIIGYDGHFDFSSIRNRYDGSFYYFLRCLPAFSGSLLAPLVYLTLLELSVDTWIAALCGSFLVLETCFLLESRIIVTDAVLFCSIALAIFFHCRVKRTPRFCGPWYLWLLCTGLALGACISTKWTALGTVGFVGIDTLLILAHTWKLNNSFKDIVRDWVWRFVLLFCVLVSIYFMSWILHFVFLPNSGSGDGTMSAEFRARLSGGRRVTAEPKGLIASFFEIQSVVYTINQGITMPHGSMSSWWSWPFLWHGMGWWGTEWDSDGFRHVIYLLGNPLVWWLTSCTTFATIMYALYIPFRSSPPKPEEERMFAHRMLFLFGFLASWLPFLMVRRVTFLYHYLPELYYAIILCGLVLQAHLGDLPAQRRSVVLGALFAIALACFIYFIPITYGTNITKPARESMRWISTWD